MRVRVRGVRGKDEGGSEVRVREGVRGKDEVRV